MALFFCRHVVCQPSVSQWVLHLFPSTKGRSCEQSLSGISAVLSTLGDGPGSTSLPGLERELHYTCTCVPPSAEGVQHVWALSMFCSFSLMQIQLAQGGCLLTSLFLRIQAEWHWNAIGFLPFTVHAMGLTRLLELSPEGWLNGEKKSALSMYLVYFSITIFTS